MPTNDYRISVQAAMRAAFPQAEARVAQFYQMQEYQLGWRDEALQSANFDPGKLLRPYFCLLACRIAGSDAQSALPLAAAIQLVHDFSLIHDDIEDDSETRRGRTTVWKVWGLAQGINTGDGMLIVAHLALHALREQALPAEVILEVMLRFEQTILTICEGQFLDLSYENNLTISEGDYLAMISRKTAALLAAATGLGAIVGGADKETATALFDFGHNLGLAFQVQDDVLGIWGDPELTGKPFAADLYRRKLSLPVIHALHHADVHTEFAALYQRPSIGDAAVRAMLTLLDTAESRSYTEHAAATYHQRALAALDRVQSHDAAALAELRRIAEGLVGRQT